MLCFNRKWRAWGGEEALTYHGSMKDSRRRWHGGKFKLFFQEEISMAHNLVHITVESKHMITNVQSYVSPEKIWTANEFVQPIKLVKNL